MTVLTEIGFKTRDEKEERGFFVLKLMLAAVGGLFLLGLAEEGRGVPAADRTRSVCLQKKMSFDKINSCKISLFFQCLFFGCNPTIVSFDFFFCFDNVFQKP